jgi:hypothetical protein
VQLQEVTTDRASMQLRPAYANCQQRLLPHRVAGGKQFAVLCDLSFFFYFVFYFHFYFIFGFLFHFWSRPNDTKEAVGEREEEVI